ncbi:MAG: NADH:ubiquinone reductase (Na(+)-transporting) subunit D [Lentisphaerae bacterium]|jgi:Na+-transporting NADH:ubiquinone oxidoreductase subunit D|nr:NADH:ubiquinone reductase (Na(+)-transporting) subunit D [Lentisphaerota bacterium]MBT4820511.1 NADH:ubiquinone reductase (Na(+)-transporting) subunit D [Lentisphaerota bacterium]MBT5608105.1 NADH:ubiquinone reductase (Na(+)-transporting) subunit D [Lentisphaerota bacterium]MBT7060618.1 NADH:ubiquinone reductase (Na(+)-transporting) subunit D [Lentisphaerota bacterium]MBT7847717.1 NADH:ubiquinone reductase (Na(+)-transporting) subunit D [Lentisphaerota bacterium]
MAFKDTVGGKAFLVNLWQDNPVFRQVLGICSTLAVTNLMKNTALMCAGLVFTTAFSSLTVSFLRKHTPKQVRMMAQVLIIAAYVIIVGIFMKAYFPEVHKLIGPYVGLIITNCIIMGRCEAFATQNTPWPSFLDGLGAGIGYSLVLIPISMVRETLGFGTLLGFPLPGIENWTRWTIMVMPPGAFFMLALVAWFGNTYVTGGKQGSAA